jgi:hypothetical protein
VPQDGAIVTDIASFAVFIHGNYVGYTGKVAVIRAYPRNQSSRCASSSGFFDSFGHI